MKKIKFFILLSSTLLLTVNVFALDMPEIKPGLWKGTTVNGDKAETSKFCMGDNQNLKEMMERAKKMMPEGMCQRVPIEKVGSSYISKSSCDFGAFKMSSVSTISGDFSSEYTVEIKTNTDSITLGKEASVTTITSKHIGPCPADMKAGDTILPDGSKHNTNDMMKEAEERRKKMDPKQMEEMKKQLEKLKEMRKKLGN